jgi:hypothetical protein
VSNVGIAGFGCRDILEMVYLVDRIGMVGLDLFGIWMKANRGLV